MWSRFLQRGGGREQGWVQREPSAGSQVLEDPAFYLKSKGKKHKSSVTHPGHEKRLAGRLSVQRERKGSGANRVTLIKTNVYQREKKSTFGSGRDWDVSLEWGGEGRGGRALGSRQRAAGT